MIVRDRRGVEPLAFKIMVGLLLAAVSVGIGLTLYGMMGERATQVLSYSVTLARNSVTIGRPVTGENTLNLTVNVELVGAYDENVALSATGLPAGVTVDFGPAGGIPPFGSTMTIRVSNAAALGTTTVTVRASGADGTVKTASLELTVV